MITLSGQLIVRTGAARGQGAAEAELLTRCGATVIAVDILPAPGCRQLDVTDAGQWAALAQEIRDIQGRVDGLVNNAEPLRV